jgi:predicted PurR-regulated permease PerM
MNDSLKQHWPWYAAILAALALLWLLGPILMPFIVGASLAYLGDPLVDRLETWRLSRTLAVSLVFVVLSLLGLLVLLLLIPALYHQLQMLIQNMPGWLEWIQNTGLPRLGIHLPAGFSLDPEGLKAIITQHWSEAGGLAKTLWTKLSSSGIVLVALIANLTLIPIVAFYLLRDWDHLVAWIRDMIPPRHLPQVTELARETDDVLGSFIRGQLTVMAALAVLYSAGLALAGLKLALIIGTMAGLLSFVPYLGFAVGFVAAVIAMYAQSQELLPLLWVAIVFGIGQMLESAWLTPNLVGDKIGLHPVTVIFALMAGGQLFGFIGILVALPVSAVLAVLLRHAKNHWLASPLYRNDSSPQDPLP